MTKSQRAALVTWGILSVVCVYAVLQLVAMYAAR